MPHVHLKTAVFLHTLCICKVVGHLGVPYKLRGSCSAQPRSSRLNFLRRAFSIRWVLMHWGQDAEIDSLQQSLSCSQRREQDIAVARSACPSLLRSISNYQIQTPIADDDFCCNRLPSTLSISSVSISAKTSDCLNRRQPADHQKISNTNTRQALFR